MSRFEDRLWTELVEQHGALLAEAPSHATVSQDELATPAVPARTRVRERRRRLLPLAAIGLAIAATLTAIVIGLSSGGPGNAAYAVVSKPDGTVSITIRELAGVHGADAKLASLGVPVRAVRSSSACPTRPGQYKRAHLTPEQARRISTLSGPAGSASVLITPSAIPSGDTVVIGARSLGSGPGGEAVGLDTVVYEGATPPCLRASGAS